MKCLQSLRGIQYREVPCTPEVRKAPNHPQTPAFGLRPRAFSVDYATVLPITIHNYDFFVYLIFAASFEQARDRPLDPLPLGKFVRAGVADGPLQWPVDRGPGVEGVEHPGVDVGGPADGRRVVQVTGDPLDHLVDRPAPRRLRELLRIRDLGQADRRQHRRIPGAEVLGA